MLDINHNFEADQQDAPNVEVAQTSHRDNSNFEAAQATQQDGSNLEVAQAAQLDDSNFEAEQLDVSEVVCILSKKFFKRFHRN